MKNFKISLFLFIFASLQTSLGLSSEKPTTKASSSSSSSSNASASASANASASASTNTKAAETTEPKSNNLIPWGGENPNDIFRNASQAITNTDSAKQALANYVDFILTDSLPPKGLELVRVKAYRQNQKETISVIVRKKEERNKEKIERRFYLYLNLKDHNKISYEDRGNMLIGISLNLIRIIMSNDLLHKNVNSWSFEVDKDMIPTKAEIRYKNLKINIANERFFKKQIDGTYVFDGTRVVGAIYQEARRRNSTEYICAITLDAFEHGEQACYLESETAGDGSKNYYKESALKEWLEHSHMSPLSRKSFTLEQIKYETIRKAVPKQLPRLHNFPKDSRHVNSSLATAATRLGNRKRKPKRNPFVCSSLEMMPSQESSLNMRAVYTQSLTEKREDETINRSEYVKEITVKKRRKEVKKKAKKSKFQKNLSYPSQPDLIEAILKS